MLQYRLKFEKALDVFEEKIVEADYFEVDGRSIEFYERKTGEDELLHAFVHFMSCEKIGE